MFHAPFLMKKSLGTIYKLSLIHIFAETVQGQLQDAMNFEGSSEEKNIRAYLTTIGLDYDALTKEEFVSLIGILKKSKYMKNPISQRGKARPQVSHGKGKRKKK